jgi:aryl-alcohol dehydrogenase-like predicted oxidoreductase
MYNLVKRQAEVEILPLAASEQVGVISYSPLGAGLLTGKCGSAKRPEHGRLVEDPRYRARYAEDTNYVVADRFAAHAADHGVKPAALAVAWVMGHPAVTAPIIGARNLEQLEESLASVGLDLTPAWREEISALSPAPPPATDRAEMQVPHRG